MKNAMKKLLSLVLVAMLLVSAVPFQASALTPSGTDDSVSVPVKVWIKFAGKGETEFVNKPDYDKTLTVLKDETKVLTDTLWTTLLTSTDNRTFDRWENPTSENVTNGSLPYSWLVDDSDAGAGTGYFLNLYIVDNNTIPSNNTGSQPGKEPITVPVAIVKDGNTTSSAITVAEGNNLTLNATLAATLVTFDATKYSVQWVDRDGKTKTDAALSYDELETYNAGKADNQKYSLTLNVTKIPVAQKTLTLEGNGGLFSGNERTSATYDVNTTVQLSSFTAPTRSGYQFAGWFDDRSGGNRVTQVTLDTDKAVYAHWTDVDAVTVTAVYYKNGVRMNSAPLLTWTIPSGENAFDYIYTHKDVIRERVPSGYTWGVTSSTADDYFYNYDNSEGLSAQNLTANGTKSVCVRFYSTSVNTAKVQLYVHTKVGGTATIYEMKDYGYGYVLGDEVTRSQVEYVVKKNYTGSNMTIQGLYSDASWTELCNGKSPTAASGVEVTNANFKVHVIVKNATTAKADTSNPKTGDAIFAPVAVLTLSTAALAAVYFISKKRVVR